MPNKRRYGQPCPVAHALDLIGERWALLVVRELFLGARRYADLQAALPDVGPSVLAQRLRDLEQADVLHRRRLPPPAAAQVYELTPRGYDLEPVFVALTTWGLASPTLPVDGELSEDAAMLAVRALLGMRTDEPDPTWTMRCRVRLRRDTYTLGVDRGVLTELTRGEPTGSVTADIATDRRTLHALLVGTTTLSAAYADGRLRVEGDEDGVGRLFGTARPG